MKVIPDFKAKTIIPFLQQNVSPGSTIYTHGLKSFEGLPAGIGFVILLDRSFGTYAQANQSPERVPVLTERLLHLSFRMAS